MAKGPLYINRYKELVSVEEYYFEKHIKVLLTAKSIKLRFNEKENCYIFYKEDLLDIFLMLRDKFSLNPEVNINRAARKKVIREFSGKLPYYDEINEVLAKCKKYKKYNRVRDFVDYIFDSEELLMEAFELLSKYVKLNRDFYCLVDLIIAKQDILKSLAYIVSPEEVEIFEKQYSIAIKHLDTNKLKELLETAQEKILKHWETFLTNPDEFVQGGPFRFLCHSLGHIFSGEFKSNIVSMSLLTEKLFDCFANEYGFILPPTNIIGADSKDMYINNSAEDDYDMLSYTTIKKINAPERLVKECFDKKQHYKWEKPDSLVYSEVAKRNFDPIGIFCLTDGSKNINPSYQNAHKLQENFPELKVIEIDKTLYIEDRVDLIDIIVSLVLWIRDDPLYSTNFSYNYLDIKRLSSIGAYDSFFEDFMELKKNLDYDETDIIKLYEDYENLIFSEISLNELFLKFQPKEINVILKYNVNCGVSAILYGKKEQAFEAIPLNFHFDELSKVYSIFKNFAGDERLNDYIPGLADFLVLFPKISSFDMIVKLQICSCSSFLDINRIIVNQMSRDEIESDDFKNNVTLYLPKHNVANENDIKLALPRLKQLEQIIREKTNIMQDYINALIMLSFYSDYCSAENRLKSLSSTINETIYYLTKNKKLLRDYENKNVGLISQLEELDDKEKINEIEHNIFMNNEQICILREKINWFRRQLKQRNHNLRAVYMEFKRKSGYDYMYYQNSIDDSRNKKNNIPINQVFLYKIIAENKLNKILDKLGLTYGMLTEYCRFDYSDAETQPDSILKKVML